LVKRNRITSESLLPIPFPEPPQSVPIPFPDRKAPQAGPTQHPSKPRTDLDGTLILSFNKKEKFY
jgi:hypothetical protein